MNIRIICRRSRILRKSCWLKEEIVTELLPINLEISKKLKGFTVIIAILLLFVAHPTTFLIRKLFETKRIDFEQSLETNPIYLLD